MRASEILFVGSGFRLFFIYSGRKPLFTVPNPETPASSGPEPCPKLGTLLCALGLWGSTLKGQAVQATGKDQHTKEKKQKGSRRTLCTKACDTLEIGAGDGIRTHDPNLGKVMLYP